VFRWCVSLVAVVLAGAGGGCAFEEHRAELAQLHAVGAYGQAAALLDDPKTRSLYDTEDEVLWRMDRGAVALATGDTTRALAELEEAKRQTEFNDEKDAGEVVAEWLLNDNFRRYVAEPYEDMYLSVLTMTALLQEGRVEPGAANEARRFGLRSNVLRDRYNQQVQALRDKEGNLLQQASWSGGGGEFVESPLGAYLASLSFMAAGQRDSQRIVADRMIDAIRQQRVGAVREADFADLAERTPADTNVVIVAFAGRGPTKRAQRLPPIVIDKVTFYAEIPVLVASVSRVASASAEFEGGEVVGLALAEDMNEVVRENYERTMPLVQGRAIARAAARAVGAYFITEAVDKSNNRKNDAARWATQLGLLAAQILVERADVRAWVFMPGRAFVGTTKRPEGASRYRIIYKDAGGGVVATTEWRTIDVSPASPLVAAVGHTSQ
jgi:hypothetical protein